MVFKNATEFIKAVDELQKYQTSEQRAGWESSYNFISLRKYNEEHPLETHLTDMQLPVTYTSLLNEHGELIIGKDIVWFDKGYNYFIPEDDNKLLIAVKQNPTLYEKRYKIISEAANKVNNSSVKVDGVIKTDGNPDARYQKIWAVNGQTGPWRKTIYEITSNRVYVGHDNTYDENIYNFTFDMYIKLEWWNSHSWQLNAGEERHISYNISGYVYTHTQPISSTYTVSAVFNPPANPFQIYSSSNYQQQLASGAIFGESYDSISYDLNGSIDSFVRMNNVVQTESIYPISGQLW